MSYVALATHRFDEMLAFYHQRLGLELIDQFQRPGARGAFVNLGQGARLELIDATAQARPMQLHDTADDRLHIVIECVDIAAEAHRLDLPSPKKVSWGALVSTLRDPDGLSVWFLQWLPAHDEICEMQ